MIFLQNSFPLGEFLSHGLDDVVGVAVRLGEDQGLGDFVASREYLRQFVAKRADHGANLVWVDDGAVQVLAGIRHVFVLNRPPLAACQPLALLDLLLGLELATVLRAFRVDDVDLVADIDTVGDGLLMRVLADDVLLEEPVRAVVRRGRQADEIGIEIFQHLAPQVVDRTVAFVDDDEVEELRWNPAVVDDRHRFLWLYQLGGIDIFRIFVHLPALEQRVHPLDGADADLAVVRDV